MDVHHLSATVAVHNVVLRLPVALLLRRMLGAPLWLGYRLWLISALGYALHGHAGGCGGPEWISGCARIASRLGHGIRVVFAAPGVAAFAAKNAAGRSAEYRVDTFAVDIGLGPELLSALRWFTASSSKSRESTACGLSDSRNEYGHAGRARHAAVRIPRPTHPPLDRRMARIAARVSP